MKTQGKLSLGGRKLPAFTQEVSEFDDFEQKKKQNIEVLLATTRQSVVERFKVNLRKGNLICVCPCIVAYAYRRKTN